MITSEVEYVFKEIENRIENSDHRLDTIRKSFSDAIKSICIIFSIVSMVFMIAIMILSYRCNKLFDKYNDIISITQETGETIGTIE